MKMIINNKSTLSDETALLLAKKVLEKKSSNVFYDFTVGDNVPIVCVKQFNKESLRISVYNEAVRK